MATYYQLNAAFAPDPERITQGRRDMLEALRPLIQREAVNTLLKEMRAATDFERAEMIGQLRAYVCVDCGALNPQCQCWNEA